MEWTAHNKKHYVTCSVSDVDYHGFHFNNRTEKTDSWTFFPWNGARTIANRDIRARRKYQKARRLYINSYQNKLGIQFKYICKRSF